MTNEKDLFHNINDSDIIQLVRYAQGAPTYLKLQRACFRVADMVGIDVDYVIGLVTSDNITLALIEESQRCQLTRPMPTDRRGQEMIF